MEVQQVRISKYCIENIRRIGANVDSGTDDASIRHMIQVCDIAALKSQIPDSFNCLSKSEVAIEESKCKIIMIAGNANANIVLKRSIEQDFADLMRECTILNILSLDFENMDSAFLGIMQKDPTTITTEDKLEAFKLLPKAIKEIGVL